MVQYTRDTLLVNIASEQLFNPLFYFWLQLYYPTILLQLLVVQSKFLQFMDMLDGKVGVLNAVTIYPTLARAFNSIKINIR